MSTLKPPAFQILLSLAAGPQHGYALMQDVEHRTAGQVRLWPATLYGTIRQLLEAGWIAESPAPDPGDDPRRRYYALTPAGRRLLAAERERLRTLLGLLDAATLGDA